ncbi:MAG: hypothetical protein PVG22_17350 [Chromatiales bacterium]
MNWKLLLLVLCLLAGINWFLFDREIKHAPGIQVAQDPQVLPTHRAPWSGEQGLRYRPLQRLVIKARLLSRNNISLGSWDHISPVDLGLGWRRMSDTRILQQLDCTQYNAPIGGSRFLSCQAHAGSDIRNWSRDKQAELWRQLTHVHAIPATQQIEKLLSRLRPGQILALDGQLVEVQDNKRRTLLKSSTILGDRNCEVMWVESVQLFD